MDGRPSGTGDTTGPARTGEGALLAAPVRGPAVGLFADQEIRLLRGPLFVGESYTTEREVVALSGSRRTESMWVRTTVFGGDGKPAATMLLNLASIKQSYARYEEEYAGLYGKKSA